MKEILSREQALEKLLKPITWDNRTSLKTRKNYITGLRSKVSIAYPFMNAEEKELADKWFEDEKYSELWSQ